MLTQSPWLRTCLQKTSVVTLLAAVSLSVANIANAGILTFTPTINGTAPNAAANQTIQNSLNTLGNYFQSPSTPNFNLNVSVTWSDLGYSPTGFTLGSAGASSYYRPSGSSFYYGQSLYRYSNNITSTAGLQPFDIVVNLNNNPNVNWDYTQATPTNFFSFSLASVVYHEGFHALDFLSDLTSSGTYQLQGSTTIFGSLLENSAGQRLTSLTPAQRQAAATGGDNSLFFGGANATVANGGNRVAMYAPAAFENGSSGGSHVTQTQTAAPMMRPGIPNGSYYTPSPIELAMMKDIGWNIAPVVIPESSSLLLMAGAGVIGLVAVLPRRRR